MNFRIRIGVARLALLILLATPGFCGAAAPSQASAVGGWAEVEITPPLGMALGGRGGVITLANEVLDPLFAQVVYLRDSHGTGFALLSFDLVGLSHELSDRIRLAVSQELGIEWNLIVLNSSHTHSGPIMSRGALANVPSAPPIETAYHDQLVARTVDACRTAARGMQPVTVEVFEGASQVGINRRGLNPQGARGIIPDPDGAIDETVWVLKLSPTGGGAPAVVFSYSCHPVIVYGYAYAGISADFPGAARRALRERLGAQSHAQFVQGLAGNVRPRILADLEQKRFRRPTPADVEAAGTELAGDVLSALESEGRRIALRLSGTSDRPFLARGEPPPRQVYEKMAEENNSYRQGVARYWLQRYDAGESFGQGDPWPIGLIRLSEDQWICYLAGEPCVEWRPRITRWLAPRKVVLWGYTPSVMGYLPTEELLPEGGYEVNQSNQTRASTPAPFAPGFEEAIRRSFVRQAAWIESDTDVVEIGEEPANLQPNQESYE
jgi:neutral ceramidase